MDLLHYIGPVLLNVVNEYKAWQTTLLIFTLRKHVSLYSVFLFCQTHFAWYSGFLLYKRILMQKKIKRVPLDQYVFLEQLPLGLTSKQCQPFSEMLFIAYVNKSHCNINGWIKQTVLNLENIFYGCIMRKIISLLQDNCTILFCKQQNIVKIALWYDCRETYQMFT